MHSLRSQLENMGHIHREDKFSIEQKSSNGESYVSLIEDEKDKKVSDILVSSHNSKFVLHISRPIINLADCFLLGMRYINRKWQLCMDQVTFVSVNVENSESQHKQSIHTTETVYSYAKLLRSQREMKINPMKLKASGAFVE